ncbi:MAG: YceI family protein [Vicinamibacteria bacterium]
MRIVASLGALLLWSFASTAPAAETYVIDPAKSTVQVHVGKTGLLSFAGHLHEVIAPVTGTITADPDHLAASRVELGFATAQMRVSADGEPKGDAPKVEEVMRGPAVLDVPRFPEIHFASKAVAGRLNSPGVYALTIAGVLSLHGITREISVPVTVTIEGRTLTAVARTTIRHDQFAMKAVSAGGGTVKVANEIRIDFRIVAEQR